MTRKGITTAQALAKVGISQRVMVDRIMRTYARATEADIMAGKGWYYSAQGLARELSAESDLTVDQVAAVISHLSPRLRWSQNVASAIDLVRFGTVPAYVMSGPEGRARKAMVAADPFGTFGVKALKTQSFARNITGDMNAVTVDVWAARVVCVSEEQLKLTGVYEGIAHCYRLAAKRAGIDPAAMQAITWIVVRGSAV